MSNRTLNMDDRLYDYLLEHSLRESETLRRLRERTQTLEHSRMQISPEQGQFMALLVKLTGALRILEIGTFTGYSALCLADAMPAHGKLVCCDLSEEWTGIGRPFWEEAGVAERIDLRVGPALETLDGLLELGEHKGFDLAFVDADKINYINYYQRCLELIRPGGLNMFDNTLWGGAVADPTNQEEDTVALRALNDALVNDDRIDLSLVPIGDGLTLARKR
jgi:predicted O-methyltransferase YrrM